MNNIIEVKDLTKRYKDGSTLVTALEGVSFQLKDGNDMAILGPSGSGKTTLLQLAGGLDRATGGDVVIDGKNLKEMNDIELSDFRSQTMGFVFQMINLHDFLSAHENVALPMLVKGVPRAQAFEKALELLKQVGLEHRAKHLPKQLSGGEQQRVAVARALANNPKIIFADEPTGKLDKANSEMVINILEKISHDKGTSVVMITHDENIAKRFSRVIKLDGGKVVTDSKFKPT